MRFEVLEKYFTLRSNGSIYMLNLLSKSSSRVSSGISGISGTLGEMPALLMYSTTWESWTQFCRLLMPSDKFLSVQWHGLSETQHIEIARKSRINIGRHRSALSGSNNFGRNNVKIYKEKKTAPKSWPPVWESPEGRPWRDSTELLELRARAGSPRGRDFHRGGTCSDLQMLAGMKYIFNQLFKLLNYWARHSRTNWTMSLAAWSPLLCRRALSESSWIIALMSPSPTPTLRRRRWTLFMRFLGKLTWPPCYGVLAWFLGPRGPHGIPLSVR